MPFSEISASEFSANPFELFNSGWPLLMAGDATDHCNAMTVSWGAAGTFWGKPSVTAYVRQSRYTKTLLDAGDTFALVFLPAELKAAHKVFGSKSGRDVDKTAATGLTPVLIDGVPVYEEASLVIICRKALVADLPASTFADPQAVERWYSGPNDGDLHTMYVGSVEKVLRRA